jgi:phosphate transport system substrate-binding protein
MSRPHRAGRGARRFGHAAALLALALWSCAPAADRTSDTGAASPGARVDLLGAGATFPYPLYARWFNEYAQQSGVRINYQSIGSGGGIRQLIAGTVDFGATDVPMTDEEIARIPRGRVVHIPTVLGAVGVTYHVPGLTRPLRLAPDVLADIFLGVITRWDDPRIAALNPDAALPDRDVLVVHRSDGSGTSYIFTDYLTSVSPAWAAGPGRSKDVRWPVGLGGKGNEGVAGQVKQMPGAIGYVEATYARQNRLPLAQLQNASGNFVAAMAFEIAEAATSALAMVNETTDLRLSIVNAPGANAYPIASFTWMLVAPELIGPEKTAALRRFLEWSLHDGDQIARTLGYEPLPQPLADRLLESFDAQLASRRPG